MISCDSINYIAYLEGEDPDGAIEKHLKQCTHCRRELGQYQKLIQGLVAYRRESKDICAEREETIESALGEREPDATHLSECSECKDTFDRVAAAMKDLEKEPLPTPVQLPEAVAVLVEDRKKNWLDSRIEKVLDFQGIKDEKEREKAKKKMLEAPDDYMSLAAFPDDLIGEKKEEDGEDKDK